MSLRVFKNGTDDAFASAISGSGSFKSRGDSFIKKKNLSSSAQNLLILADGCAFDFFYGNGWHQVVNWGDMEVDPLQVLDQGTAFVPGTDYFVYLCLPKSGEPKIVVSANTVFSQGYDAGNSQKIGGFHYGHIRAVDESYTPVDVAGEKYGTHGTPTWKDNVSVGIVPNSVWDLKNRPQTLFGGLVKVGAIWMSIYPASVKRPIAFQGGTGGLHVAAGELQSKYGEFPATGTEGLCQYNFVELAFRQGMRLPSMQEWLAAAVGNPQGEDGADHYGWTKKKNTTRARTGCKVNPSTGVYDAAAGIKPFAISAYNVVDMIGNVWEWTGDYIPRQDAGPAWGLQDVVGKEMGKAFLPNPIGLASPIMGGRWPHGTNCGPRAVGMGDGPWQVNVNIGSRLVCPCAGIG
jgi:hypothetical protein